MEYALAKRHPLIGQQLALPECRDLPAIGTADSENCLKLGIPRPENVEPGRHIALCSVAKKSLYPMPRPKVYILFIKKLLLNNLFLLVSVCR
jgi:hypothetical protein